MRLIDADALKTTVESAWLTAQDKIQFCKIIDNAETIIPFASVETQTMIEYERPQGEWIKWNFKTFGAFGDYEYKCSNCEKVHGGEYNFCPNCGADMRGEKK